MERKRKFHAAGFKAQVALAAVKGDKTVSELASLHGLHPTMIYAWKKQWIEHAEEVFESAATREPGRLPIGAGPVGMRTRMPAMRSAPIQTLQKAGQRTNSRTPGRASPRLRPPRCRATPVAPPLPPPSSPH